MKVKGKHRKPKKCSFFHLFHRVSLGSFKADGFEGFITKKIKTSGIAMIGENVQAVCRGQIVAI